MIYPLANRRVPSLLQFWHLMIHLSRTVRFVVNPPGMNHPGGNSYAGNPPLRCLAPFHEITVVCAGPIDPVSGYLINIKTIDAAVREVAVPRIALGVWSPPDLRSLNDPALILTELVESLGRSLPVELVLLRWHITPFQSFEMTTKDPSRVTLRTRFDLSASHRLYVRDWTEQQNREAFGKCAHPSGHGHNYEIEPSIIVPVENSLFEVNETIERLVNEAIIDRYDHKHLNLDTTEFGEGGLNPSVENIARVWFDQLNEVLKRNLPSAQLADLTVWETPRTSATYSGITGSDTSGS